MRISLLMLTASLFLIACQGTKLSSSALPSNLEEAITPTSEGQTEKNVLAEVGPQAPNFTLEDRNGNNVSLSDFRGKPVLIEFWATWCPFCMAELPELHALYQDYNGAVEILAIDRVGSLGETREHAIAVADAQGWTFPILFDEGEVVYKTYRFAGNPSPLAYFIDKDGAIVDRKAGPKTMEEVQAMFDRLLEE